MTRLPRFDAPPVTEVVLGVQFAPLQKLSAAHCGLYWREHLGGAWTDATQVDRLEDAFEKFGDESEWVPHGLVKLRTGFQPPRSQFTTADGERMIQVQDSRFLLNWRKRDKGYPRYAALVPDFEEKLDEFRTFLRARELGDLEPNQWEITYVNHIFEGSDWQDPASWAQEISHALAPPVALADQTVDSLNCSWSLVIGDSLGRLHIHARSGYLDAGEGSGVIRLSLTARGPIPVDGGLRHGLDLGHSQIVRSFDAMTTPRAHMKWKRAGEE